MKKEIQNVQESSPERAKEPIALNLKPEYSKSQGKATHSRTIELSPDKVPIEKLRAIWNDKEVTYTDDELYRIRNWLYSIADVTIGLYNDYKAAEHSASQLPNTTKQNPTQHINPTSLHYRTHEAEESHSLHPGVYRRAS